MTMDSILGLIRHILTFGAGYLISTNVLDDQTAQQAIAGIMALVAVAWSTIAKHKRVE